MESQFGFHLTHSPKWNRALAVQPEICPGKDPEDTKCTCTDLIYSTRIRLASGATFNNYIYCGCCDLPVTPPAPGGAGTRPTPVAREAKDEVS